MSVGVIRILMQGHKVGDPPLGTNDDMNDFKILPRYPSKTPKRAGTTSSAHACAARTVSEVDEKHNVVLASVFNGADTEGVRLWL